MAETKSPPPLNAQTIAVLVMFALLVLLGLVANVESWQQGGAALVFGASVLLLIWLWQRTLQHAQTALPLTWRQQAWNAVVFFVVVAVVGIVIAWQIVDRKRRDQQAHNEDPPALIAEPGEDQGE